MLRTRKTDRLYNQVQVPFLQSVLRIILTICDRKTVPDYEFNEKKPTKIIIQYWTSVYA
jgi:hypothetical protein